MTSWNYMQIAFVPFFALTLVLCISATELKSVCNIRRYQRIVMLIMSVIVVDVISWFALNRSMAFSVPILWGINIVYFLLSEIIAYCWLQYVVRQIYKDAFSPRQARLLAYSAIPMLVVCAIIIASPWNHIVFTIHPENHTYARGSFHVLQAICGFSYMLAASLAAYFRYRKVSLYEEKKECNFLCHITLLPFVGGILQIINYNLIFLWPFTAAAAFLMFVDYQSHRVSVDPLTGLNNRGTLERYMSIKAKDHKLDGYLLMMDVDSFKEINDRFGHIEGDRALKLVAQTLKNVFGETDSFFSRYGGDEFVVITRKITPEDAIGRCEAELQRCRADEKLPYAIHLSIGYAKCDGSEAASIGKLIQAADTMMYMQKRTYKNNSRNGECDEC